MLFSKEPEPTLWMEYGHTIYAFLITASLTVFIIYLAYRLKPYFEKWMENFNEEVVVRAGGRERVYVRPVRGWKKDSFMVAIVILFVSFIFEYVRLIQVEFAKIRAEIIQEMPLECRPSGMLSWFESVQSTLIKISSWNRDRCADYQNALVVNPVFAVNPLKVLLSLLITSFTDCLVILASSIGKCLQVGMAHIPPTWQPIVLAMFLVLFVFLILVWCNCRVSTWFGTLERHNGNERNRVAVRNNGNAGNEGYFSRLLHRRNRNVADRAVAAPH